MARQLRIRLVPLLIVLTSVPPALAEWNPDPAQNLAIADRAQDQVQPKVVATSDGGCYISWFDNSTGGYDVYLQRLDAAGDEQWAHHGLLVADRGFSSTQDYGLDIDSSGNALLVFRDDRSGTTQVTASKIAPDGTLLWGSAGVQLTSGSAFFASPKIAGTSDGGSVAGWTQDSGVTLQKLDASGSPLWGTGVALSDTSTGSFSLNDVKASDGNHVIVSWVRQGPEFWDPKHIWAQKFNDAGRAQWGLAHVKVFDSGSLQFGNFPTFLSDGSGGAIFRWYITSPLQCSAQRIGATGTEVFSHNGEVVSTDGTRTRVSPDASFIPATEETFVFWTEMNSAQSQWGVYGQRFDDSGSRMWGQTGKVVRSIGGTQMTQISTEAYPDGPVLFFVEAIASGNQRLFATRLDTDGNAVWSPEIVTASSVASEKSRLATTLSSDGVAILVWSDGRAGDRDIYAQNVKPDGGLGPACDLVMGDTDPDLIGFPAPFYVAAGLVSGLRHGYSAATCVGYFPESPGVDPLEDPPPGDGRYYLARGVDHCPSYGDSSLDPDPRDWLDAVDPCP